VAQQLDSSVQNNFTKGLITESTGLNFPENAATSTDNCVYTLIGDVLRREGINYELNNGVQGKSRINQAISTYKWNNAGGDGDTQIVVNQVGNTLYFYESSAATVASPLSTQLSPTTVNIAQFLAQSSGNDPSTVECQYTDGNGYIFVFHPYCDPFYCTFVNGVITPHIITVQIRDFAGIPEPGLPVTFRPLGNTTVHQYNLINQGWSAAPLWNTSSQSHIGISVGTNAVFTDVPSGLPITIGQSVNINGGIAVNTAANTVVVYNYQIFGVVNAYFGGTLSVNIGSFTGPTFTGIILSEQWYIMQGASSNYTSTWFTDTGTYPSNADVWWEFKDSTDTFNPTATSSNVTLSSPAPKGSMILNAFNQQPGTVSGVSSLGSTVTAVRPRTGTWFQGRIFYTGVDSTVNNAGPNSNSFYTWTENIYFSQIVVDQTQFPMCYQTNDPTSENLFDLLPSDGGVITIPGSGSIYKLYPLQNALIVFAANGVWYITGNTGIGFTANDYTVVQLSHTRSISSTSFVDVNGVPYFWNEEGIYAVQAAKQGTSLLNTPLHVNPLEVIPITLGTILTFYNSIPLSSKQYARGAYDPVGYIIQWVYRDTEAPDVTGRYTYNKILNFDTSNSAFFPYTVDTSVNSINGIVYVASPGGLGTPDAIIKYVASNASNISFADEHDESYLDWGNVNYDSFFVTGYKLAGKAIKKFQPQYIQVYSKSNGAPSAYKIQGIWNYANNPNSGKWSTVQVVTNTLTSFDTVYRRHKLRGSGYALQFKIDSVDGQPFDIQGWGVVDTINAGT
jgi:hypothetical protein